MEKLLLSNLSLCSCLSLLNVACSQTGKTPQQAVKQPNIILILADDIGFETIGSYGSAIYKTPRIDKMAEQ